MQPKLVTGRLRRDAEPSLAGRYIRHDTRFGADLSAGADGQVTGQTDLPRCHHKIAERGGPGDPGLRHQQAMPADDHVVADLDQVIDLRAFADDRIAIGAAVESRVWGPL